MVSPFWTLYLVNPKPKRDLVRGATDPSARMMYMSSWLALGLKPPDKAI
jgi:hypothetical protein